MSVFTIIAGSFGLGLVKPVIYRLGAGKPLVTGEGGRYVVPPGSESIEQNYHLAGGSLDSERLSYLGTPVFCDVEIERGDGREAFRIETCLIDVSQTKNIVTTVVQGRNGTVKEYISDGDYEVQIRGALVTDNYYPREEVRDLHELLKRSELLTVVSDYLLLFDIKELVVTSYSFKQQEGYQNVQLFEINAISDDSKYRLILND
jgi:hypothetical protein